MDRSSPLDVDCAWLTAEALNPRMGSRRFFRRLLNCPFIVALVGLIVYVIFFTAGQRRLHIAIFFSLSILVVLTVLYLNRVRIPEPPAPIDGSLTNVDQELVEREEFGTNTRALASFFSALRHLSEAHWNYVGAREASLFPTGSITDLFHMRKMWRRVLGSEGEESGVRKWDDYQRLLNEVDALVKEEVIPFHAPFHEYNAARKAAQAVFFGREDLGDSYRLLYGPFLKIVPPASLATL